MRRGVPSFGTSTSCEAVPSNFRLAETSCARAGAPTVKSPMHAERAATSIDGLMFLEEFKGFDIYVAGTCFFIISVADSRGIEKFTTICLPFEEIRVF